MGGTENFRSWVQQLVSDAGSLRKAAKASGLSHVTIKKAIDGRGVLDVTTLQGLAGWANVSLYYVLGLYLGQDVDPDDDLEQRVAMAIQTRPQLQNIMRLLIASDLTSDDIADLFDWLRVLVRRRQLQSD